MDSVQKDHDAALQYDFRAWKDRAERAKATIKAIQSLEHISIVKVRALQDLNPELAKSQWVLYSSESTCKYPTIEALLNWSEGISASL